MPDTLYFNDKQANNDSTKTDLLYPLLFFCHPHFLHLNALLKIIVSLIIRFTLFFVTFLLFPREAVSLVLCYLAYPLSFEWHKILFKKKTFIQQREILKDSCKKKELNVAKHLNMCESHAQHMT